MLISFSAEDAKTAALALGGLYFIFKFALGYLMINATLQTALRRQKITENEDLIIASVKISKGDRECLQLDSIKITPTGDFKFSHGDFIDFTGMRSPNRPLRLSPGEETSFEFAFKVPTDQVTKVDVELKGWSGPFSKRIKGYWYSSAISEPVAEKKAPLETKVLTPN